ncbi:PREDICTED: uncharacterized protein At4g06744-like [Nelumbo nucifera]|uniref:Uncharacterized protein At4g06744-like n=2 Tax=Nelumbo nucifera TaxID=4432 RepID=A0A1U8ALB0_NELNU|nr:PREDICTED: uncharacterized protein At4g06744-like [Nelumbo nucifera]DAD21473.1 TPA_asm: hypothetical protein HUJ06_022936 [Nelumbo nucifera]
MTAKTCIHPLFTNSLVFIFIITLLPCFLHAQGLKNTAFYETSTGTLGISVGAGGVSVGVGVGVGVGIGSAPAPEAPNYPPPPEPEPLIFENERLAVVYPVIHRFKKSITSDPHGITNTWVGPRICNYTGFYCDHPPDDNSLRALAGIDFNGYQLGAPTLDDFVDQLPDIAIFHANTNNFAGAISPKIAQLRYLYELDLSNNKFSGQFPMAVLGMDGLSFLDIRFNSFTGTVPAQIFTQPLDVLFINNNNFMQTLPANLGSTPVRYLTIANNRFVGPIPRSIGNASATLVEVLLLNNQLSGCLPYEIGLLRSATVFDAGNNLLTGPIPCSFGCLEKMELLNLAGNQLYGQIPEAVCALRNLVNLSLSDNYFTSVGPTCRNLIKNGVLNVNNNCIHGLPNQRSVGECSAFHPGSCPYPPSYSFSFIPCELPQSPPPRSIHSSKPSTTTAAFVSSHRSPPLPQSLKNKLN